MTPTNTIPMADALDVRLLGDEDRARYVPLGNARALEVVRETPRAVLIALTDARGDLREQWFPRSVLRFWNGPQADAFGATLLAARWFVAKNDLWHWTAA